MWCFVGGLMPVTPATPGTRGASRGGGMPSVPWPFRQSYSQPAPTGRCILLLLLGSLK